MDLKSTYNKIAEDWYADHRTDDWWREGTDAFVSLLKQGNTVLDVGCGGGVKTKYLAAKGLNVTGVDFSEKMIEIAKREAPEGRFYIEDISKLNDLNEKFDGVFAQAVLLHVPKKKIALAMKNLTGKLRLGGYLYVAVKQIGKNGKEEQISIEKNYGYEYERFFSYFTITELKRYFKNAGLEVCYENTTAYRTVTWIQIIGKL